LYFSPRPVTTLSPTCPELHSSALPALSKAKYRNPTLPLLLVIVVILLVLVVIVIDVVL